jgi:hypothetical protein
MERPICINAIIFQAEGMWIAQCLEYNLVSCAETLAELPGELMRQVRAQLDADRRAGTPPFFGYKPAAPKYWTMYEEAKLQSTPILPEESIPSVQAQLFQIAA